MKHVVLNVSFALFVTAWGISHAQAAAASQPSRMEVSYADLNLGSESGARVMLSRLQAASKKVCGGWPDLHNVDAWLTYRYCVRNAMNEAVAQLHAPMVATLHGRRSERLALGY